MNASVFPAAPGDYVLWLDLPAAAQLTIGRLGVFDFTAGVYAYGGGARGPGGLAGRLRHHAAPAQRPHWHIDYLRAVARLTDVWWRASPTPQEHAWAHALAGLPGARLIAPRFGASDCGCPSHCYTFAAVPVLPDFAQLTGVPLQHTRITEGALAGVP
jgi:Uri superfamily endonuclease